MDGTSYLHLAANVNAKMINILINYGANVNYQNCDGYTSLHVAAMNGCIEGVRALLANGADREIVDNELMTARDYVESFDDIEILKIMDESTCSSNELMENMSMCQTFVNVVLNSTVSKDDVNVEATTDKNTLQLSRLCLTEHCTSEGTCNDVGLDKSFHLLSNSQLRDKLISYGEHPGPITDFTRNAYISYLKKIASGVQPSGDKGYKGNV